MPIPENSTAGGFLRRFLTSGSGKIVAEVSKKCDILAKTGAGTAVMNNQQEIEALDARIADVELQIDQMREAVATIPTEDYAQEKAQLHPQMGLSKKRSGVRKDTGFFSRSYRKGSQPFGRGILRNRFCTRLESDPQCH